MIDDGPARVNDFFSALFFSSAHAPAAEDLAPGDVDRVRVLDAEEVCELAVVAAVVDHEVRALARFKRADFVLHDCADYRELAYFFGVEHAHAVYVGGREVFRRA